jgi:hypothetical protein
MLLQPNTAASRMKGRPERSANEEDCRRAPPARVDGGRMLVNHGSAVGGVRAAVARRRGERVRSPPAADITDDSSSEDDERERNIENEQRDEPGRCNGSHHVVLERAAPDADQSVHHDCENGRLQSEEKARHRRGVLEQRIERGQRDDDDEAGEHEKNASDDAAARAVQKPTDVRSELLRFGTGQQHAIVQRMQESRVGNPPPAFDQFAVHERDLSSRASKTQQADLQPNPEGFAQTRVRRPDGQGIVGGEHRHSAPWRLDAMLGLAPGGEIANSPAIKSAKAYKGSRWARVNASRSRPLALLRRKPRQHEIKRNKTGVSA